MPANAWADAAAAITAVRAAVACIPVRTGTEQGREGEMLWARVVGGDDETLHLPRNWR